MNNFSYVVAENKDPNGYTVETIKNNEGKEHALLLKKDGSNLEGITAEDEAYNKYLAGGKVPDGQFILLGHLREEESNNFHTLLLIFLFNKRTLVSFC
ncbi:hypothetical protein [Bacillus sp. EB600]|uniref:hypothetical protein n=1 Tax=Bacillus sp. EB600 TaxID=2806345 RepID=UPI002108C85F|nr:hypothetical protein [Bacillus sp. EB600]MCQ6282572.1 hypothetical protein [Bacillus sp. EB600]